LSHVWVKPWPNRQKTNRKHPILKIFLKNRTKLHFLNLRISKRTTSFYFLFLQNSPNSRDCRFPCNLTHTIILFAYIGYNKRAPLTNSSSQCRTPHIEIILVIMKFESGKPKHQLRFSFNTLLMCTDLLSQLKLRKSLYSPPHIFSMNCMEKSKLLSARNCKLRCYFKCLHTTCEHLLEDRGCCSWSPSNSYYIIVWYIVVFSMPQGLFTHLQIWCIQLVAWKPKSNKVQINPWSSLVSFTKWQISTITILDNKLTYS